VPRFHPFTRTPGLLGLLHERRFAGPEPEDTVACRVATWQVGDVSRVLISPPEGVTGNSLGPVYAQVANHYYLELLLLRKVTPRSEICWLQHWPARDGAPTPHDEDQFENIHLRWWRGRLQLDRRQQWLTAADALLGSAAER
jgi:hypothetical protein